jgi:hypothetical protein
MKTGQTYTSPSSPFQMNKSSVITGAALIGAGGLIALIGVIISGTAAASACRKWLRDLEVPPSEVVKQKWDQTKAATAAGTAAWQQHNGIQRAHA